MDSKAENCPSAQVLAEFSLALLDARAAETISQHLETCVECRQSAAGVPPDNFFRLVLEAHGRSVAAASSAADERAAADLPIPAELAASRDYEIVRALGRGGMGVVYLVCNLALDRLEVLKIVSRSLLDRPGAIERFQREIRSAARLSHPNVVAVYSAPRLGDLLILAMEYVDGQNLAQIVAESGPLLLERAALHAQQVALGLQHAHEKGMVHRDIKPGNLMLTQVGATSLVKIVDFGLAKVTSEGAYEAGLTTTGQVLGTPDYIAPEQALDATRADIRADIYSLGCTLYHLLAGHPPFRATSVYEVMHAHHQIEALRLDQVRPDVPAGLADIVAKMMAKDPEARFQSPAEVAQALVPFIEPQSHALSRARAEAISGSGPHGRPASGSSLSRLMKVALLALLVVGAAALAIVQFKPEAVEGIAVIEGQATGQHADLPGGELPPLAIFPFDARQARVHQAAWASHLKLPVEQTNSIGMKLVLIPPGVFLMGSTEAQSNAGKQMALDEGPDPLTAEIASNLRAESPQHRVKLSGPFLLGATEVTVGQFRRFVAATKYTTDAEKIGGGQRFDYETRSWINSDPDTTWQTPGYPLNDELPVTVVSWNDAVAFCNWLSDEEGLARCYRHADAAGGWLYDAGACGYRLPTEAEWEYSCRSGSETQFSSGNDLGELARYGWFFPYDARSAQSVGHKLPNGFGLHDMHGNVWEWCHDRYGADYYLISPAVDPTGPAAGTLRVDRGGCWFMTAVMTRSACRQARLPTARSQMLGFRVARMVASVH